MDKVVNYKDATEMRIVAEDKEGYKVPLGWIYKDGGFMISSDIIVKGKSFREMTQKFKAHVEFLIGDKWERLW